MTDQTTKESGSTAGERWFRDGHTVYGLDETGQVNRFSANVQRGYSRMPTRSNPLGTKTSEAELEAIATLISSAPAMDLALKLLSLGCARIERSGSLVEFCFGGFRYCMNGDWTALMDVIGWERARAAIAKATGQ